ncbi:ferredoxin reductase family protein [Lentzea sp. NPDC005914]|uniref:ferredoxin reductase family protein n=1 Tax=Lentzea sp. NPDC005914 TaxID=3154572 RepID=UPI0033DEB3BC
MTAARIGLAIVLGANATAVTSLYIAAGPSTNAVLSLGRLTGLYGAPLMAFQLVLIARIPWLDRRLGMDRLTSLHRWNGFTVLWLLVAHTALITVGVADRMGPWTLTFGVTGVLRAVVALALITAVGIASARWARRKLAYETWHFLHLYLYVAIVLAFSHQIAVGQSFTASGARLYWWTLWGTALAAVAIGRLLIPLWRNGKHQLRVEAVVPESEDVVSVYVTGRKLDELPARAGQFFLWRFLAPGRWWQANPFSLSAAPNGFFLRLTAKALGDGSAALKHLKPGTRVFAEGPYGAFTALQQQLPNVLLIAGGVGVTPIRALLEELRGDIVVLYRVNRLEDAVLINELLDVAYRRGAEVRLLCGPPDAVNANGPLLGPRNLDALVPDARDRDVFLCGPPPMVRAVLRTLRDLEVPQHQVHTERFSLAT